MKPLWKCGILQAAEEIVRAGVLEFYALGSESVSCFTWFTFYRLVCAGLFFVCVCWGLCWCLFGVVWLFLFRLADQSLRPSCLPMTTLITT